MKKILYPLKFEPILKTIIWGGDKISKFKNKLPLQQGIGESWEISGVEQSVSIVADGTLAGNSLEDLIAEYKGDLVGKSVYDKYGNKFPLLIKFIDAQADLSIQVHPNDAMAKERHSSFGKTEMWYVVDAEKGASLYSGFKKKLPPQDYEKSIKDGSFTSYLDKHAAQEGDVFFLPAGRVHAIGAGMFVAEIQQTSDITYRIYDYDRPGVDGKPRALHVEQAKEAIDFALYDDHKTAYGSEKNKAICLIKSEYFKTNLLDLDNKLARDYSDINSFVILMCTKGSCSIISGENQKTKLKQGETILIPAIIKGIQIAPKESVTLLETYI